MPIEAILSQLQALGLNPTHHGDGRVTFPYRVPVGRFQGQAIELGLKFPGDFPLNPPTGPHVKPRLLPLNNQQVPHPNGGIHEAREFGEDWEYWSRPFPDWPHSARDVRAYMQHVRALFDFQ